MLISKDKRQMAVSLINEAVDAGARCFKACAVLRISMRTFKRWTKGEKLEDQRQFPQHKPANKLSLSERNQLLSICNSEKYACLPPSQIIPMLADQGYYIASESTFYRVLREEKQLHHRGRSRMRKNTVKISGVIKSAGSGLASRISSSKYTSPISKQCFFYKLFATLNPRGKT